MGNHDDRLKDIGKFAVPPKGTKAFKDFSENYEKRHLDNPEFTKYVKESLEKANAIIQTQNENGAGLPIDQEIRYFLREFNGRNMRDGLDSMPSSFNVMEAFFNYRPEISMFEMLEEEDYLFNLYDFIDYVTSPTFEENPDSLKEGLVDDLIYNYNITNGLDEITFSTENGGVYVVGGISIVKRGNEVVVFLLTAETKPDPLSSDEQDIKNWEIAPGKENLLEHVEGEPRQVLLFDRPDTWKTLAYCRYDLDKRTIDARYIQKDVDIAYTTLTDDKSGLVNVKGDFLMEGLSETYDEMLKKLPHYEPIFELAAKCLYLPLYFETYNDNLTEEEHQTRIGAQKQRKAVFKKDRLVPHSMIIRNKTVWRLDRKVKNGPDTVYFGDNDFKLERDGFWRKIDYSSQGKDKNGNPIQGRTWVERTQSWYEKEKQTLTMTILNQDRSKFHGGAAGSIYLMRNASHPIDVFKIGLTTRDSKSRAKELSATTGSVDKFLVANEWGVSDCALAEKLIHSKLESHRVNDGREFFKVDYKFALETITKIVDEINRNSSS